MIHINPYSRNCEVLKNFFSKPIILIISILLFLSSVISISVEILLNNIPFMPITVFISAIGFLIFYIKGKSKSDNISFNLPANLLTVSSIFSIVFNFAALLLSALFLILNHSGFNLLENTASYLSVSIGNLYFAFTTHLNSFVIYSPIYLFNILSSIAMLVMLGSIKKSSRSIYLYKKGSLFLEFSSFALASAQIALILYNDISIQTAVPITQVIISLLIGIFSAMYNKFINNISSNVFVPQPTVETIDTTPVTELLQEKDFTNPYEIISVANDEHKHPKNENYDDALVGMWEDTEAAATDNVNANDNFASQTAFVPTHPDYEYPESPILAMDNPIPLQPHHSSVEPQAIFIHEEPSIEICPSCGATCPPEHMFCGNCGFKIDK